MKVEKKLKRGLMELSPLFTSSYQEEKQSFIIQPPQSVTTERSQATEVGRLIRLVCASFLPVDETLDVVGGDLRLLNMLGKVFRMVHLLSIAPSLKRYEALSRALPIPPWEHATSGESVCFHALSSCASFAYVPESKFRDMVQLKPALWPLEFDSEEKTLALFDYNFLGNSSYDEVLHLLDHAILVFSASSEHLMQAYDLLRFCFSHNQSMRFSILLVDQDAGTMGEFVYERFSEIVAQFVGCDLGFLGWVEKDEIRLNPELLLDEAGSAAQTSSKIRLSEALRLNEC